MAEVAALRRVLRNELRESSDAFLDADIQVLLDHGYRTAEDLYNAGSHPGLLEGLELSDARRANLLARFTVKPPGVHIGFVVAAYLAAGGVFLAGLAITDGVGFAKAWITRHDPKFKVAASAIGVVMGATKVVGFPFALCAFGKQQWDNFQQRRARHPRQVKGRTLQPAAPTAPSPEPSQPPATAAASPVTSQPPATAAASPAATSQPPAAAAASPACDVERLCFSATV